MSKVSDEIKIKIYNASKVLQKKAGTGKVSAAKIKEAEKIIEDNTVNFVPIALDYLKDLNTAMETARKQKGEEKDRLHNITLPIMHLKSTGTVFKYPLVSELSDITLTFLETAKKLDQDVLAIVDAHRNLVQAILATEMKSSGGAKGKAMKAEMASVCDRYMKKHNISRK